MSKYSSSPTHVLEDPIAEAIRQWNAHGWTDAALGMATVTTITRVNRVLVARVEDSLSTYGLTFARFEILRLLGFARDNQLPMGKIGDRLQVHPASVTSAVKRLERDGMIERQNATHDNRIVLARLLPLGVSTLEEATEAINRVFETLELDRSDLATILRILGHIRSIESS